MCIGVHLIGPTRAAFKITEQQDKSIALQFTSLRDDASGGEQVLILDGALQRDPNDRRRCIVGPDGQEAQTVIKILASEGEFVI